MDEQEPTFFVMNVEAGEDAHGALYEYSLVQIPFDKIEKAVFMQDGIEKQQQNLDELREEEHQFGSSAHDEISKVEIKIEEMKKKMNDYLGKNAISFESVVERAHVATFEIGDGIGKSALEDMMQKKVLEINEQKSAVKLV